MIILIIQDRVALFLNLPSIRFGYANEGTGDVNDEEETYQIDFPIAGYGKSETADRGNSMQF